MRVKTLIKTALLGPPGQRVRTIRGGLLRGYEFPIDTASMSMQMVGLWETEIHRAIRTLARRASIGCDVGANSGWYALYFATLSNIKRVFAFEAQPHCESLIKDNLQRNAPALLEKATVIMKLVGDRDDDQWCRIDTVLRDIDEPIIFKIDVDGGELDVLSGARRTLATKPCHLVIETHSPQLEQDCIAFLRTLGYRTRIIRNGWYRVVVREDRPAHNRWMTAIKE